MLVHSWYERLSGSQCVFCQGKNCDGAGMGCRLGRGLDGSVRLCVFCDRPRNSHKNVKTFNSWKEGCQCSVEGEGVCGTCFFSVQGYSCPISWRSSNDVGHVNICRSKLRPRSTRVEQSGEDKHFYRCDRGRGYYLTFFRLALGDYYNRIGVFERLWTVFCTGSLSTSVVTLTKDLLDTWNFEIAGKTDNIKQLACVLAPIVGVEISQTPTLQVHLHFNFFKTKSCVCVFVCMCVYVYVHVCESLPPFLTVFVLGEFQ
jgi:hypothetical protein